MNFLFASHGTAGDVHPFIGLGIALKRRGHHITFLLNEHFSRLATDNGFGFIAIGTEDQYRRLLENPGLWSTIEGARMLGRLICEAMPAQYQAIAERNEPGNTVVVSSGAAFGAMIAHEELRIPIVTIALQPAIFRSAYKMPVIAGAPPIPDWMPPPAKRLLLRAMDVVADRIFQVSAVNAFRAKLGLSAVRRITKDWWLSPQRIIALFPDWFGTPQPDWPSHIRMTGFPLYDERPAGAGLSDDVQAFLDHQQPPIVFTPGTGMMHGHAFFEAAVEACELLDRPGILLTRYTDQLPKGLPDSVRHFSYVPFSQLLPHTAALVHHGGVGTLAQAIAAGIPQLVMPMAYDQPDNAARLKRLGVGDWLKRKAFRGPEVARRLQRLLDSPEVALKCREFAQKLDGQKALEDACDLIEQLG